MQFRLHAKHFLLTYAQSDDLLRETTVANLYTLGLAPTHYSCGLETHENGGSHIHLWVDLPQKVDTTNPRYFDIDQYHPNISTGYRSQQEKHNAWEYTQKEDTNAIASSTSNPYNRKTSWSNVLDESSTVHEFLEKSRANFPRDYVLNYQRLEYFADKHFNNPNVVSPVQPAERPFNLPIDLQEWLEQELPVRFILFGGGAPAPSLLIVHYNPLRPIN